MVETKNTESIKDITSLQRIISLDDILLFSYEKIDAGKYRIIYYPKSKSGEFYTGIKCYSLLEAKKTLVSIIKAIQRAKKSKRFQSEYLVIINNTAKLLSEVTFADENELTIDE